MIRPSLESSPDPPLPDAGSPRGHSAFWKPQGPHFKDTGIMASTAPGYFEPKWSSVWHRAGCVVSTQSVSAGDVVIVIPQGVES